MQTRHAGRLDGGALILGAILLIVGVYYLLTNTFGLDLPDLNWDMIWPLFVIAIGASIAWSARTRRSS